jgi:hypothetical protein
MERNESVYLYLDRDKSGMKNTQSALKWDLKYTHKSDLYKNHKDLNDCLVHQNQQQRQKFKLRRSLQKFLKYHSFLTPQYHQKAVTRRVIP